MPCKLPDGAWRSLVWATAIFVLALAAACGEKEPKPSLPQEEYRQQVIFRVLDGMDRSVAGATLKLEPRQGRSLGSSLVTTDRYGQAIVTWRPQIKDISGGSRDMLYMVTSDLDYHASAKGFFPALGRVRGESRGRILATTVLQNLNQDAKTPPLVEVVVMRHLKEALGGELAGRPLDDGVIRRCLAFHRSMAPVTKHLGAAFAWPAFSLEKGHMTVRFKWLGSPWAGLSLAPWRGRVLSTAGLPLARACGEELLPLEGVRELTVEVTGEQTPPGDARALPAKAQVLITAPAKAYRELAQGRLSNDRFLAMHPPELIKQDFPEARPTKPKEEGLAGEEDAAGSPKEAATDDKDSDHKNDTKAPRDDEPDSAGGKTKGQGDTGETKQ